MLFAQLALQHFAGANSPKVLLLRYLCITLLHLTADSLGWDHRAVQAVLWTSLLLTEGYQ